MTETVAGGDTEPAVTKASAEDKRARPFEGKSCFVIMPYGMKSMQTDAGAVDLDFDDVYDRIIQPAIEADLGLNCEISRKINRSGLIHKDMIERIIESDAVVVDITLNNPNVFYELGVRHTARRSGTVIIRRRVDQTIPFNINGLRVFDYEMSSDDKIKASREMLATNVAASLSEQSVDSLVYTLTGNSMSIRRIGRTIRRRMQTLHQHPKLGSRRVGIVTGDICHVDFVDVWLNPENTRMQMGRMHDESLSACVRYLGGKKDIRKAVVQDSIADELRRKIGPDGLVEAGHVIVTGAGGLGKSNRVRRVIHAAAMHGEPTKGYQLIRNYASCLTNALGEMDLLNSAIFDGPRLNPHRGKLRTILVPLYGTRDATRDPQVITNNLVLAATNYLEDHPNSGIECVYFLAFTDIDRDLLETAFRGNDWKEVK